MFQQSVEPLPRETLTLAATAQPFEPDPNRGANHSVQASIVAVHSEVVEVSDQASLERCVLDLDRKMPVAPAPFGDGSIEPPQALAPRLAPHLPASATGTSPVHREPEKIERARPLPIALSRLRAFKRNEPSLLRMQLQSKTAPSACPAPPTPAARPRAARIR